MAQAVTQYDIVINYCQGERELAASVVRRLEQRGLRVWYDASIGNRSSSREETDSAVSDARMLVILFSGESNSSRHLRKELALADALAKPVLPILTENTQPRGAFLYELAGRNWLRIFPDPTAQLDDLIERLAMLAGVSPDQPGRPEAGLPGEASAAPVSAPAAPPRSRQLYGGRLRAGRPTGDGSPDIPPLRLMDAGILLPACLALITWQGGSGPAGPVLGCLMLGALYGAFVFPARYYRRGYPPREAIMKHLASSGLIFAAAAGALLAGAGQACQENAKLAGFVQIAGLAWTVITPAAFAIYGALARRRAIGMFRSNIKKP